MAEAQEFVEPLVVPDARGLSRSGLA